MICTLTPYEVRAIVACKSNNLQLAEAVWRVFRHATQRHVSCKPFYVAGEVRRVEFVSDSESPATLSFKKDNRLNYRLCLKKAISDCVIGEYNKLVVSRKVTLNGLMNYELVFNELVRANSNCFVYYFFVIVLQHDVNLRSSSKKLLRPWFFPWFQHDFLTLTKKINETYH